MSTCTPGRGAHLDGDRLVVALPASPSAEAVEVCVLPDGGRGAERRVELARSSSDGWWYGDAAGVVPGDHYGVRVHGPWEPARGVRINPAKLLVDPWARRVTGSVGSLEAAQAFVGDPFSTRRSDLDSAPHVPHGVVPGWVADVVGEPPRVPWTDTVLYETHVRDLTMRHPAVPAELRGTYLGLAEPAVLAHLVGLGVTTVELLPVFAHVSEPSLLRRGRANHWGYSTLGYLAPHARYASVPGAEIAEFRAMVTALHAVGLEVVLDVVFNHTCEGGADGPSLSWRGLDAAGWYALSPEGHDVDVTGCGNTLDPASPLVSALVLDSLRYWVGEMGVDGFRFDLASTLGRPHGGAFDPTFPLLRSIVDDPVVGSAKLIAEPWDATGEGYQVGGFGPGWAEWNGRYRDSVRDFWRDWPGCPVSDIATRLAGSSDLYWPARSPAASVNFVTAHDGFTLRDLVSYDRKHNEPNGEDNRDGTDDNRSASHGVEGPSADPGVVAVRARQVRNMLATLGLSAGTPMLLGGDELGHTQHGDNNVYCLDDETSWRSWSDRALVPYVARVLALRRSTPALCRSDFFYGRCDSDHAGPPDIAWLDASGAELGPAGWDGHRSTLVVRVDGGAAALLLVLHAGADPADVVLPATFGDTAWGPVLDSGTTDGAPSWTTRLAAGSTVTTAARSFLAFRSV